MAASEHLGPQFMYHVSPAYNRESILKSGLDKSRGALGPRVYLSDEHEAAGRGGDGYDTWKVDVSGVPTKPDRLDQGTAVYAQRSIGPGRLSLHHAGESSVL